MRLFLLTLEAVVALLGIGMLGFWVIGRRKLPETTFSFLSSLAIDITLPFLVLANLIEGFSVQDFPNWWQLPLWWLGFAAVSFALSMATSFIVRKEIRSEFRISALYQNGLFFPLIIMNGIFGLGNPYMVYLFVFVALHPSMVFGTYSLFFPRTKQAPAFNWRRVINPVLIATLVGLIISLSGINRYVPSFALRILTMVGGMATPLFMLILGGNIYSDLMYKVDGKRQFYLADTLKFVFVKNVIFPLVFLGLLVLLRPESMTAFTIFLQAAVPPITATPIFAERSGGNREIASQFIVGSFLASIISIPAMVHLFGMFFPVPVS